MATLTAGCAVPQKHASRPSTFILVHGSWHGAWCYSRVVRRLEDQGHTVHALTLTGLGERSHLLSAQIALQTHVDDVVNFVKWEDLEDIVLVGHSYGGMVISGATEVLAERVRSVVFLDAFIPASGQSLFDLSSPESRARMSELAAKNGGVYINPFPSKLFGVNPADQPWVDAKCTPQPYATFTDRLPKVNAIHSVRTKLFVRSAYKNASFESTINELARRPDWHVARLQCGHDMMIDQPDETTRLLVNAASGYMAT